MDENQDPKIVGVIQGSHNQKSKQQTPADADLESLDTVIQTYRNTRIVDLDDDMSVFYSQGPDGQIPGPFNTPSWETLEEYMDRMSKKF